MNKQELIRKISEEVGITNNKVDKTLDLFFKEMETQLGAGGKVVVSGFGTFSVAARAAKKGRHPQTGVTINIPATVVPKFSPGKALKSAVKKQNRILVKTRSLKSQGTI